MPIPFARPATAVLIAVTASAGHRPATPQIAPQSERHVIAGSVTDSQGRPPRGVVVQVGAINSNGSVSLSSTPIAMDGRFETEPSPPGQYVLKVMAPASRYERVVPPETGLALVTLGGSDVRDVTIRTTRTVTVHGRFRMDSDNPAPVWPVDMSVLAALALDGMNLIPSVQGDVGPSGTFTLRGARGPHVVRCGYGLAPGTRWWPSQVLLDGRDITDVPTDLGDAENRQLEVVFTDHPARLTGTVLDANGQPAPSAQVVLFSTDKALWQRWATTSRGALADTKGMFNVALQPGRYLVRALPAVAPLAGAPQRVPERWDFQRWSSEAMSVDIADRERKHVTLTIGSR